MGKCNRAGREVVEKGMGVEVQTVNTAAVGVGNLRIAGITEAKAAETRDQAIGGAGRNDERPVSGDPGVPGSRRALQHACLMFFTGGSCHSRGDGAVELRSGHVPCTRPVRHWYAPYEACTALLRPLRGLYGIGTPFTRQLRCRHVDGENPDHDIVAMIALMS